MVTGIRSNIRRDLHFVSRWLMLAGCVVFLPGCQSQPVAVTKTPEAFFFGADLSYVNQILDKGGVYRDNGEARSPYRIFADHGANLVRLRLWHNPSWTRQVYDPPGQQSYNDLADVEKAIRLSREQGLKVLLDFHYSDNWADPGKQEIPEAWRNITTPGVLADSVYRYTLRTLQYLEARGLMPELVQLGNETNCGMLYTGAPASFPSCNVCADGQWERLGTVLNRAIAAVKEVSASSAIRTEIILHVADPKNVEWWFDNITGKGGVSGFDIVGFSYYPLWHRTVSLNNISGSIASFRSRYGRPVMILETAYPWTSASNDSYHNAFGDEAPLAGYPFSVAGQADLLRVLTQEVVDGGGSGIVYWEPAWISVPALRDRWGSGSSWENNTLFDFEGNVNASMDFMSHTYRKK